MNDDDKFFVDNELRITCADAVELMTEFLEDALPALALGEAPRAIERPGRLTAGRDETVVGSYRVHDAP